MRVATGTHLTVKLRPSAASTPGVAPAGDAAIPSLIRTFDLSIVGLGMRSHAGVAARMFKILASEGINIQAISTSEIKVSCLMATKYTELAVRALHDGFALGGREVSAG